MKIPVTASLLFFVVFMAPHSFPGNNLEKPSHSGNVFDGPEPTGVRFCINSAALRFIPKQDLEKQGYAEYKKLFTE